MPSAVGAGKEFYRPVEVCPAHSAVTMFIQSKFDCWLFDMDGTLTIPSHDFDAVRAQLGIPSGEPILEYLSTLEPSHAATLNEQLRQVEWEHAVEARVDPTAIELLEELTGNGCALGVVTRNARDIALKTLSVCDLDQFFSPDAVIAREDAQPKPKPDGVELALRRLQRSPQSSVMVGDYIHDIEAGHAAGTSTIWIDHAGDGRFGDSARYVVSSLGELVNRGRH